MAGGSTHKSATDETKANKFASFHMGNKKYDRKVLTVFVLCGFKNFYKEAKVQAAVTKL